MRKLKLIIACLFAIFLFNATTLFACPGCNAIGSSQLARAFNPSVLFMMAMPFTVFGAIAGGIAYTYWRAQKKVNRPSSRSEETLASEN